MPNHVYSTMEINGEKEAIAEFAEKHFTKGNLDLSTFVPMPEALQGTRAPVKEKDQNLIDLYGFDNWYDWCIQNWGTKWNTYDGEMDVTTDNNITCSFQTAWSLPDPVFQKMADMYPTLTFYIECVEEGGFFSGTIDIVDGIVDDSDISADNAQWKMLSEKVLGWTDEDED